MEDEHAQPESILAAQKREQLKSRVLEIGESLGNYRVVKCLCAGLLAHYYHMQHVRDLHDVTVGVFHHRAENDPKLIKRLQILQKTVSSFDDEGIPKIRECTKIEERICIFLDPVHGKTLSQYFEANGVPGKQGIGLESATRIIAQLLGTLGYAHAKGVDHRDLDSELIYVQEDGSIRILGIGIKATLGVELFESIVSASVSPLVCNKTLGRLNSFDVMSPEYKSGVSEDSRVDIYEVGFIGYWLLTGQKMVMAKYVAPSELVEDLPQQWDKFFEQSLERSQDKRYQSSKVALLGLQETEQEPQSEASGFIQRQIDRSPVPRRIVERGALATRIYRLFVIGLIGLTLTAICASIINSIYDSEATYRPVAVVASSPERATLQLHVSPPTLKVEFIDFDESFIVRKGALDMLVQTGDYKLRFSAPNYIEQIVSVRIQADSDVAEQLNVKLEAARTDLAILSEPGASIVMRDENGLETQLGFVDADGSFSLEKEMVSGVYEILVTKEGYRTNTLASDALKFGSVYEVEAPLVPLPAKVSVQTNPSGAAILLNDVELGVTPRALDDLSPGETYQLRVRLEGYRPVSRQVKLAPGSETVIDFGELIPLSGALRFDLAVLGVNAPEPTTLYDELQVVVDDEAIAYGSQTLDFTPVGERRIRLEHPLYFSEPVTVEVQDSETYLLKVQLSPKPGLVKLEIPNDLEVEVRLNGKVAALVDGQIQIPANQEIECELRMKNYLTMVRSFRLSPTESFVWDVNPVAIPGPANGQDWLVPYLGLAFSWVPAGEFEMGSPLIEHARVPSEGPQTKVRFSRGFWAASYELTQAQYREVLGQNPSQFEGANRPVEMVSWEEAKIFCDMLTGIERAAGRLPVGYVYRLPIEAEWEYAARAGTTTPFYFGSEADASMGHFRGVYPRERQDGLRVPQGDYGTAPVGRYRSNAFGLFDVHGNVREWTLDVYNGRLAGSLQLDPEPRADGSRIAVRGGGWGDTAARVRSAAREQVSPDVTSDAIGFRVFLAPAF